jgi:NitT/TauT family transport system substrate-binding protein
MQKKKASRFATLALALAMLPSCNGGSQQEAPDETGGQSAPPAYTAKVGAIKGPTAIGLLSMMEDEGPFAYEIMTTADEVSAKLSNGNLDIACIPANVASILFNRTQGGIVAIGVNTLGVLNFVSARTDIQTIADLAGKTVYLSGKGTVPDISLQVLLSRANVEGAKLEYRTEPTEVASILKSDPSSVALLPQPFATVAITQNTDAKIVLDMTEEWAREFDGGTFVTGVTVAQKSYLEGYRDQAAEFLQKHEASIAAASSEPDQTAARIVSAGIIESEAAAKKALPYLNISFLKGEEMKTALSGYLGAISAANAQSVGGALPGDEFYYMP